MDAFFAAVINDQHGQRVFYIGESDEGAAASMLLRALPELQGSRAAYHRVDGTEADAIGLRSGTVLLWPVGAGVRFDVQAGRIVR